MNLSDISVKDFETKKAFLYHAIIKKNEESKKLYNQTVLNVAHYILTYIEETKTQVFYMDNLPVQLGYKYDMAEDIVKLLSNSNMRVTYTICESYSRSNGTRISFEPIT